MPKTLAYTSYQTQFFVDDERIEQVRSIVVDWTNDRLRIRGIWAGGKFSGQQRLERLKEGLPVRLRIVPTGGDPIEWEATVRFSRMRVFVLSAITFTAEFEISRSSHALLVNLNAAASS